MIHRAILALAAASLISCLQTGDKCTESQCSGDGNKLLALCDRGVVSLLDCGEELDEYYGFPPGKLTDAKCDIRNGNADCYSSQGDGFEQYMATASEELSIASATPVSPSDPDETDSQEHRGEEQIPAPTPHSEPLSKREGLAPGNDDQDTTLTRRNYPKFRELSSKITADNDNDEGITDDTPDQDATLSESNPTSTTDSHIHPRRSQDSHNVLDKREPEHIAEDYMNVVFTQWSAPEFIKLWSLDVSSPEILEADDAIFNETPYDDDAIQNLAVTGLTVDSELYQDRTQDLFRRYAVDAENIPSENAISSKQVSTRLYSRSSTSTDLANDDDDSIFDDSPDEQDIPVPTSSATDVPLKFRLIQKLQKKDGVSVGDRPHK
ncbi:hypothetical protein NEOLI_000410 [Neolecta irregularis DAH-3]|uniref:Uncharacterized protein n=1 Tax=Neolecta irregularis (strain DAH-3) TaxID=1198029 RepID=A0A1U7LWV1_NEOID|nr:hypothetical protein NEOLI_000410 [Neolecta irregularis DAH-3]|eukprot:OLL27114.1 hypothetical protein NEOLI_000410 [Neolecta irregularis DAH-3]